LVLSLCVLVFGLFSPRNASCRLPKALTCTDLKWDISVYLLVVKAVFITHTNTHVHADTTAVTVA